MNHLTIERLREIVADGVSRSWGWVEFRAMAAELLAARETIAAQLSAGKALYEATQKLMAERDAARTELAAASERVDLDIDEFRRIKAELGDLRVGLPPLTEGSARSLYAVVAGICDRAVAAGRQRVPLIAQRDKAEAERDEARQHHENALAIAGHNIERVKKLDAENKAQFETLDALRGLQDGGGCAGDFAEQLPKGPAHGRFSEAERAEVTDLKRKAFEAAKPAGGAP